MVDMTPASKYLSAADLRGQDARGVIAAVQQEEIGNPKESCWVVYFQNWAKAFVLNVTNTNLIIDQLGAESDNWPGHEVTLFPTTTDFGGKQVACIRVRPAVPAAQSPLGQNQQTAGDAAANLVGDRNPPPVSGDGFDPTL